MKNRTALTTTLLLFIIAGCFLQLHAQKLPYSKVRDVYNLSVGDTFAYAYITPGMAHPNYYYSFYYIKGKHYSSGGDTLFYTTNRGMFFLTNLDSSILKAPYQPTNGFDKALFDTLYNDSMWPMKTYTYYDTSSRFQLCASIKVDEASENPPLGIIQDIAYADSMGIIYEFQQDEYDIYGSDNFTMQLVYYSHGNTHCGSFPSAYLSTLPLVRDFSCSIYPNPASDNITITFNRYSQATNIRLYTLLGECVYTSYVSGSTYRVPVAQLPNGVYILQLNNADINTQQHIIVSH